MPSAHPLDSSRAHGAPRLPGGGWGAPELRTAHHPRPNGLAFGAGAGGEAFGTLWVADSTIRKFELTVRPERR